MKCPKCQDETLDSRVVRGVEVDRCPACQGVWFDEEELSKLIDDKAVGNSKLKGADKGQDRQPGVCPRDGTRLLRVYSKRNRSVVLDCCSECKGVWLDGGEFQRLKG